MCYRNVNEGDTLMETPQGEFDRQDCGGGKRPGGPGTRREQPYYLFRVDRTIVVYVVPAEGTGRTQGCSRGAPNCRDG